MVSLAIAYLESHAAACGLLGEEPPVHVSMETLTERVVALSDDQLVALLTPISALGHSD
jgi:hypothetical protein